MPLETIIRMIRKDVNELKNVVIPALKAEIEELKKNETESQSEPESETDELEGSET